MKRFILTLCLMLAGGLAQAADAIVFTDTPGQTLYVRVRTAATTSVAAAMTEGTGNGVGFYVVTDATLAGAGLSGSAVYPYKIFSGTPSTSADDPLMGVGSIRWVSTVAVDPLPLATPGAASGLAIVGSLMGLTDDAITNAKIAADAIGASELATDAIGALELAASAVSEIAAAISVASFTPVSADVVGDSYTWFAERYRANNIVELEDGYVGPLALVPDMNPGVTITTVDSVTITGAATVVATGLTVDRSRTRAQWTVPALTTVGTYTVRVKVTTVENQQITTTGTLKVY